VAGGFGELGTAPFFIRRLGERGIRTPQEIQRRAIPPLRAGENLLFRAPTGTGKTFAYLLPLLERLFAGDGEPEGPRRGAGPRLLICAPTYELCSQIKAEADFLLRDWSPGPGRAGPRAGLFIGSAALGRQIETLKKERPGVAVGNPGRLLQLERMGQLRLRGLGALVLDEGDRLVADELRGETEELVRLLPGERQSAACSATLSAKSRERLLPLLGSPCAVLEAGGEEVVRKFIEHWAFFCEGRRKITLLRSFLAAAKPKKALVFTGRGGDAGKVVSQLQYHHIPALALHGDLDKKARRAAAEAFRSGKVSILVSSDLAARGLDFPGLSHIVALDVPDNGEAYIHRAGRTGRAGKRGIMVSIGDEGEMRRLAALEKRLGITVYPKELHGGRIIAPLPPGDEGTGENPRINNPALKLARGSAQEE
jgi:superfamily II DNA/RNA helicase